MGCKKKKKELEKEGRNLFPHLNAVVEGQKCRDKSPLFFRKGIRWASDKKKYSK